MSEPRPVPLRCRCGLVRGVVLDASPATGQRVVCYCDDCQAAARWFEAGGRDAPRIMDARGGTDIFQIAPARVRITEGAGEIRCLRLSEKGLWRWYAGCCRTPLGNTVSPGVPFIGLVHTFMDPEADGRSRDEALGAPTGIQGRFAAGGVPPNVSARAPLGLIVRSVGLLLGAWLARKGRPSPFYDPATGAPVVTPLVLTGEERDRLRQMTAPPATVTAD